jgi:hypothetical protein
MSEPDAIALANRSGYKVQASSPGLYIFTGDHGPDSINFCDDKLFFIAHTFNGDFPMFIGLVQQRQARLGEPSWKIEQRYATGVQPVKQLSTLTAQWDGTVERLQSLVTLLSYGKNLRITEAYNAQKYLLSATMSQKSSVPQAVSFVSRVLKRDSRVNGSCETNCKMSIVGDDDFESNPTLVELIRAIGWQAGVRED